VAIFREVHYNGYVHGDITELFKQWTDIKYYILKVIHGLKYILNIKMQARKYFLLMLMCSGNIYITNNHSERKNKSVWS
jgi:hypothetical protein